MIVVIIELIQHNTKLITTEMEEWEQYLRYLQTPSITARRHVKHAKTLAHGTTTIKCGPSLKLKPKLILKLMLLIKFCYSFSNLDVLSK